MFVAQTAELADDKNNCPQCQLSECADMYYLNLLVNVFSKFKAATAANQEHF